MNYFKASDNKSYLIELTNIYIMYVPETPHNQYGRFNKSDEYAELTKDMHPVEITKEEFEQAIPKKWSGSKWMDGMLHGLIMKSLKEGDPSPVNY